jgi:hypothetical protein
MLDPKDVFFGLSINRIVELCGVDVTTARRWKRRAICPPQYVLEFIQAKDQGDLGFLDPAWRGWKLRNGCLWSPESWEIRMSDVLASRLHEAQLAAWREEVRRMKAELAKAQVDRLEEQPTPDSWDVQILVG